MNQIFATEEKLEGHLHGVAARGLALATEMAKLQREVEDLENPRDDSMDNDTVVWCSHDAFSAGQAGMSGEPVDDDDDDDGDGSMGGGGESTSANHGSDSTRSSDSVHAIIGVLEEAGVVCKRCSDPYEAIERARELQRTKRLRCVIFGGGEKTGGCGKSCRRSHENDGKCLRCGHDWQHHDHRSHLCYAPLPTQAVRRGTFVAEKVVTGNVGVAEMTAVEFFTELTANDDTLLARKNSSVLPTERTCLYGGNAAVTEKVRLKLWSLGTAVRESAAAMNEWVDVIPEWPADESKDESDDEDGNPDDIDSGAVLQRQQSLGSARLDVCRRRLAECEAEKALLEDSDEDQKKQLRLESHRQHAVLMTSVEDHLHLLNEGLEKLKRLQLDTSEAAAAGVEDTFCDIDVGPGSGRNAALALAWLESEQTLPLADTGNKDMWKATLAAALCAVASEVESLRQIALAAKVMAYIPSPTHKKLLNLTHDWLRTYLPHCLGKVNRVSFGLLNSNECAGALEEDPFTPRSRLALAVPFIGKDVPSKSAEFAHPDITLGLTVMAYRYSGFRDGDTTVACWHLFTLS